MRFVCRLLKYSNQSHGFSLIEMAIVLAIMGVVAGLSLPALTYYQGFEKDKTTKRRQEIVMHALGAFAASQGRLPYAATDKGKEIADRWIGHVPYRALGLSFQESLDGWGHPMRYVVEPSITGYQAYCQIIEPKYPLKLDDERGKMGGASFVAVILISEGKAYGQPRGAFEEANHKGNDKYYTLAFRDSQENPFRHHVFWQTRDNLINYYGHSHCPRKENPVVKSAGPIGYDMASPGSVRAPGQNLQGIRAGNNTPSLNISQNPQTFRPGSFQKNPWQN